MPLSESGIDQTLQKMKQCIKIYTSYVCYLLNLPLKAVWSSVVLQGINTPLVQLTQHILRTYESSHQYSQLYTHSQGRNTCTQSHSDTGGAE